MDNPSATEQQVVAKARQGFEKDLFATDYIQAHSDKGHLANLISFCQLIEGKHYLDLGTGNGYIAFKLVERHPRILVTGIDIVHKAVAANKQKAKAARSDRLDFVSYEGITLPFGGSEFFGVLSRYAFHHFPNPALSAGEIYRVLESGGFCIIADPVPHTRDETDFINRFSALKDDGHVRFYSPAELGLCFPALASGRRGQRCRAGHAGRSIGPAARRRRSGRKRLSSAGCDRLPVLRRRRDD
jgi:ubiquinone/menaquinone biosynthesis C-methylase UbiE